MKIHHLNYGTLHLRFAKAVDGRERFFDGSLSCVIHGNLVETDHSGLVLVDCGFSVEDIADPRGVPFIFKYIFRPAWHREATAIHWVKELGYSPRDVQHILLTHLDYDHADGLIDFPWATAHVVEPELQSALSGGAMNHPMRYTRKRLQKHSKWEVYDPERGDIWYGLPHVSPVKGLGDDFRIVPLEGHSAGHAGIAIHSDNGWILNAGDGYMNRYELQPPPAGPSHTGWMHSIIVENRRLRQENLTHLAELQLQYGDEVRIFCAHDKEEFEEC